DIADRFGKTPLYKAALAGHTEVVKLLLDKGAKIAAEGTDRRTPLHWAASKGNADLVKLLVRHGADVNAAEKGDSSSPLHYAARGGHAAVVQILIDSGANVDAQERGGNTALDQTTHAATAATLRRVSTDGADDAAGGGDAAETPAKVTATAKRPSK